MAMTQSGTPRFVDAKVRSSVRWVSLAATLILLVSGLVLMPAVAGCGGGAQRQPVSGAVTMDGEPLQHGVISFHPALGHAAPGSGGAVIDGRFEIPAAKGLQPGKYRVKIIAFKETGRMIQDYPGAPERAERLPIKYNEADQLEATVGVGEDNRFEFRLTTIEEILILP